MRGTIFAAFALSGTLVLTGCGGGKTAASSGGEAPAEEAAPAAEEQAAQVFESDVASVEYRGTQDAAGNAVVTFALTNKTDRTVRVVPENLVLNNEFSISSLTGSVTPIQAGLTGSVALTFGVSAQTTLSGTSDIQTLSGDLRVFDDGDIMNTLGSVHFDVVI